MVRLMYAISLNEGCTVGSISNEQMRAKLGIESISDVMSKGRLKWFGYIERMERES